MASSPITSLQIDGETTETVTDFIFLGFKTTADGEVTATMKLKTLAPWKKSYDQTRQRIKSRDVTLLTKVHLVKVTEKAMAPHSSTLAWKIPWTEEPGRLQSMG